MISDTLLLVLNSGSSSLKFALYDSTAQNCMGRGALKNIGRHTSFSVTGLMFQDKSTDISELNECKSTTDATHILIKWLDKTLPPKALSAVGHRVVHGGHLKEPLLVTSDILAYLATLIPLAPLHQPFNLEAIELIAKFHPTLPQVICFDTSFHHTIPDLHQRFALPRAWHDKGVRRYGFHGLSYEYITQRLKDLSPRATQGRTIVAHLGSGASLCALKDGKSFETSMGFSALDGLMMGTRPGTLDVGVILYFLQEAGLDEAAIEHMLYHDSGLLGVSGLSSDMATLLVSQDKNAQEAIDLFCMRVAREAGSLISILEGLDSFVFTAGIGEHAPLVRQKISSALGWIGLDIDESKNVHARDLGEIMISKPGSKIDVWVIPTDEESIIAYHTAYLVGPKA